MEGEGSMTPSAVDGPASGGGGRKRWRLKVGAAVSTGVVLASSGLAQGVESGGGTVRVRGAAMGLGAHFVWSRPGTVPLEPMFDVSFGAAGGAQDQLTNQNSGFAASFYPGATPATPGSVLGLVGFPIGGQVLPPEHPISQGYRSIPGLIPPWPLATQGSYPGDPGRRVDMLSDITGTIPAPLPTDFQGMTQETVVDQDVVTATTNIDRLAVTSLGGLNPELEPIVAQLDAVTKPYTGGGAGVRGNSFTLKGLNSRYESVNTGPTARSTAEVTVREVNLFGGLLEFFRVRSLTEYAGDGHGAKLTAQTTEVGMAKMLGLEVTFDDRGVKLADKRIPASQGAAVTGLLNQILDRAGFKVQTTTAEVEGNHVDEVALRIVMAEQEPTLPGFTFLGRKTTITFDVGALGSNFDTLPGSPAAGEPIGSDSGDSGGADLGVSLPAPGVGFASSGPGVVQGSDGGGRRDAGRAVNGLRLGGLIPATRSATTAGGADPGPGPDSAGSGSTAELAAAPSTPAAVRPVTHPADAKAKEQPVKAPLVLLPGVVATDAQQREIASGIEDIGRRLVILAGIAGLGGLIVWRRRRGILQ